MNKFLVQGAVGVLAVAAAKTALTVHFALPGQQVNVATIMGLFAIYTALTAGVAYVAFTKVRSIFEAKRQERLDLGGETGASKESVIDHHSAVWGLTQAEKDVALFVAKGFSNSEIADVRGSAIATVKTQLGSIYAKSGLETRYQLIAFVTDEVCQIAQEQGGPEPEPKKGRPILDIVSDNVPPMPQIPQMQEQSRAVGR